MFSMPLPVVKWYMCFRLLEKEIDLLEKDIDCVGYWLVSEDVIVVFKMVIDQPTSPGMNFIMTLIEQCVVFMYSITKSSEAKQLMYKRED